MISKDNGFRRPDSILNVTANPYVGKCRYDLILFMYAYTEKYVSVFNGLALSVS